MIEELDVVVLCREHRAHGLVPGDVGTVVCLLGPKTAAVEFVRPDGFLRELADLPTADLLIVIKHS